MQENRIKRTGSTVSVKKCIICYSIDVSMHPMQMHPTQVHSLKLITFFCYDLKTIFN